MVYKSIHRFAIISPSKVRRVSRALSGRAYNEVVAYLQHLPHRASKMLLKVTKSAAANALSKNAQLDESMLKVSSIIVNEGPRMKRIWPRARGRADVILKRMSHISVHISDGKEE